MKRITDEIFTWSVFSADKQLDFNGLYLRAGGVSLLVDPPPLSDDDAREIEERGRPHEILITNQDHRRAAPEARARFGAPIAVHELDAPRLGCPADRTFRDGDVVAGELRVVHVPDAKSPGESALYWASRRVLIVGDALIGKPTGLSLVPAAKLADPARARAGLARLAELDVDLLLVGDGVSILRAGGDAIRQFLSA